MSWAPFRTSFLLLASLQLGLAGCSTLRRLPAVPFASASQATLPQGAVRFLVSREIDSFSAEAADSVEKEKRWLASQGHRGELPPAFYLAVSGGGDNGAYGAGFLKGWTASGTRPEFKIVTGVSTGALIAPFAFLGPKYDHVLEQVYTTTDQNDIFRKRSILSALFADGMADTRPLAAVIGKYVDRNLLDEIAAEYAKGRLLLVATTNLDTLEPVVWNMTAIAASKDPRSAALFSKVLLASASIPGAFPPVMIDVTVDGTVHQEMHVDGGAVAQLFLYPPSLRIGEGPQRERTAYIIRNARLDADWANTNRQTMSIAMRAIDSLTRTQGIGDLYRIYAITNRDGVGFNLTYIPQTFDAPHREMFDTSYMKALFATGVAEARSGPRWRKLPPGFGGREEASVSAIPEGRSDGSTRDPRLDRPGAGSAGTQNGRSRNIPAR